MKILVTGAMGQVGSEIVVELHRRDESRLKGPRLDVIAASHHDLDVTRRDMVMSVITTIEPDLIIHAGAFTAVDRCESEPEKAFAVNALGTRYVAEASRSIHSHLLYISTDYVFSGESAVPNGEWDDPQPKSVYGRSKLGGERELSARDAIVRTSWVSGRNGANMAKTILSLMDSSSEPLRFVSDQHGNPTIAHDLARAVVDLGMERCPGIFHITNEGATTWFEFAKVVVDAGGGDSSRVQAITTEELQPQRPAPRPRNSVLSNQAFRATGFDLLPGWEISTRALVDELNA